MRRKKNKRSRQVAYLQREHECFNGFKVLLIRKIRLQYTLDKPQTLLSYPQPTRSKSMKIRLLCTFGTFKQSLILTVLFIACKFCVAQTFPTDQPDLMINIFQVEDESYGYDIYLSYSEDDGKCVEQVVHALVKNKNNIRIFSAIQELDLENSWQTQLYDVIKKCKRVMALITPSFLQSVRCTEQYNIALCHSRKIQESVLMPLYVTDVEYMPTYMRITQYIDCRYGLLTVKDDQISDARVT